MVKLPIVDSVISLVRKSGGPPRIVHGRDRDARLREGVEQAPVGIAYIAIDGRWLYYNERFRELLGYSRDYLARISFHDVTHPDDAKAEAALVRRLLHGDMAGYRLEKRVIDKKGKYRDLEVLATLVRSETGDPDFFVYVIDEVGLPHTPARASGPTLRESEHMLVNVIERITDVAIIRTDDRGIIAGWNAGAERIFGYKRDEVIGKPRRMLYRDPDAWDGRSTQQLGEAREEGSVSMEDWRVAKNGKHLWLKTTITPLRPDSGTTRGYIEVVSLPTAEKLDVRADARVTELKRTIGTLRDEIEKRDRVEESLREAIDELRRVGAQTMDELKIMTAALRNEIDRRKATEDDLRALQLELEAVPALPVESEIEEEEAEIIAAPPRRAWKKLDIPIAEVLVAQAAAMRTGTLIVASGERQTEIFFEFGRVFSVSTNDPSRFLAQRLIEMGAIDDEQRQRALEIQRETHLALGRILMMLGAITEDQLLDAMMTKAEEEIDELFDWRDAKYAVIDGEIPTLQLVPLRLDVAEYVVQRLRDRELRLVPLVSDIDLPDFEIPPPPPRPLAGVDLLFASSSAKGRKFHRESCASGRRLDEDTRIFFTSVDDAVSAGYDACKLCIDV